MKEITRYDVVDGRYGNDSYWEDKQGMFVKYSEHKEIVDRIKGVIQQLINSNLEKSDEIKRLTIQIIGDKIMEGFNK